MTTTQTTKTVVDGELFAFMKTSDGRLLIYKVKPAPYLAPQEPSEEEINQAMIEMRKDGKTLEFIGREFRVARSTVSKITKHLGMPTVRGKRGSYRPKDDIRKKYEKMKGSVK